MKKIALILASLATWHSCLPSSKTVLVDFHNTLFCYDTYAIFSHLGMSNIAFYYLQGGTYPLLERKFLQALDMIACGSNINEQQTCCPLYKNRKLPLSMCNWLAGRLSNDELLHAYCSAIDSLESQNSIDSSTEKQLLRKIIDLSVSPHIRARVYKPIIEVVLLIQHCKAQGMKIIVASNLDSELIEVMKALYPDIFGLFDDSIISANIGRIKPHANFFEYILEKHALKAEDCYFIDDQPENIAGAQACGISSFLYTPHSFDALQKAITA